MPPTPDDARADLARWLALAPLVVFGESAVTALGLGVTLLLAHATASAVHASTRRVLPAEMQLLVTVLVAATLVTLAGLAMRAGWPALHAALAPVLPLVAIAAAVATSVQPVAPAWHAALRGCFEGLAGVAVLLLLGMAREGIGHGTLFAAPSGTDALRGFLPVGALLALALLAALANRWRGAHVKPADRHELFRRLRELNPHPTTELEYSTPFELLIAVILSAQATDVGVNKATRRLYPVANTPAAILALGEEALKRHISSIGLYNAKAANVIATCRKLVEEHGGEVPRDRDALESLPGVGRKTANVVLNTAFGEPTIAVDTHIFRVANRTGLAPGATPLAVELALLKRVPEEFRHNAHHWLILHGRYTCKARKPDCPHCVIRDLCRFRDKTPG